MIEAEASYSKAHQQKKFEAVNVLTKVVISEICTIPLRRPSSESKK